MLLILMGSECEPFDIDNGTCMDAGLALVVEKQIKIIIEAYLRHN
jgi:hypothetical protein